MDSVLRVAAPDGGVDHVAFASAAVAEQCVVVCGADSSLGIALIQMLARLPNTRVIVSVAVVDDAITRLQERLAALALNVVFIHAEVSIPNGLAASDSESRPVAAMSSLRCR